MIACDFLMTLMANIPKLPLLSTFFLHHPATTEIYTLSLHDALPICRLATKSNQIKQLIRNGRSASLQRTFKKSFTGWQDRKSGSAGMPRPISYAVFCLKKKNRHTKNEKTATETKRGQRNTVCSRYV